MIVVNPDSICQEAKVYYYEYLCEALRERIPAATRVHINKCLFCQTELDRLRFALAKGEERAVRQSTRQRNSVAAANLRLHFAHTGTLVTCDTAKPFLPSLAEPSLVVGVPTPITVHLDKCEQCANDLETIRQLGLTHKQLCRLGQLFAEGSVIATNICAKAQNAVVSVVSMVFGNASAEVLKHLCNCPDCRELIFRHRDMVHRKSLRGKTAQEKFLCDTVSPTKIFDYVVPYGIDPATDQHAEFRTSLASHASTCPTCLGKMQKLHSTVYGILERERSGVVTCFEIRDSDQDSVMSSSDDVYNEWPITVQVFDKPKPKGAASAASLGLPQRPKQRPSNLYLKQFIKPAAAAAVILVAIAMLVVLNAPAAKAVEFGQVYEALERIKNVCITTFYPEEPNPTQEIWISRTLNVKMLKTERQFALWDLKDKSRKSRDLNSGLITMAELDNDGLMKVKETMEGPLGLLPFSNMPQAPEGAEWRPVANEKAATTIADTEIYDLMWAVKELDGSTVHNKWRGYIDIDTNLPKRIEWWEKRDKEEYNLLTVIKVDYPTTGEVRAVIREAGF